MADIELRFHKDMLVLSAPLDVTLERQGIQASRDRQYLNLMEPDVIHDALRLELMAGAQCVVTTTEDITRARLTHINMEGSASQLAHAALDIAQELKPQHVLVEIGPCGLPLDTSSKASLNENRAQYADAAREFEACEFDAFFLNGFTDLSDLKCALMGVAQVSAKPLFASVTLAESLEDEVAQTAAQAADAQAAAQAAQAATQASLTSEEEQRVLDEIAVSYPLVAAGFELLDEVPAPPSPAAYRTALPASAWPEALEIMVDLGVSVVGFETKEPLVFATKYAQTAADLTDRPILAQLCVRPEPTTRAKGLTPVEDIREYTADTLEHAAVKLFGAGVQFLRATGLATPACTGAIAATVQGLDVRAR